MKKHWSNKIPILVYHRIVPMPLSKSAHGIWVKVQSFKQQMELLSSKGFQTVSLDRLIDAFNGINQLPKKSIILTFDDGYKDNYLYAFPILKEHNFTATIFLVSGYIGGTNEWDKTSQEGHIKLLSTDEIKEMAEYGISFGVHTITHPHLPQLNEKKAFQEIVKPKEEIEKILGQEVISFCYPYGEYNDNIKNMVIDAGYKCACACDTNAIDDIFELRRIQVFPKTNLFGFWKKTQKWYLSYNDFKKNRVEKQICHEGINKILIVRFSSIGDIILTTPILKALKEKYPEAKLFYVTKKEYIKLVELFPCVDYIFCLDSNNKIEGLFKLIKKINLEKIDLLIDLHYSLRSIILYYFSFAKYKLHYSKYRFIRFLRIFFKWRLLSKDIHVIDYYFKPLERLGINSNNREPELRINKDTQERIKEYLKISGVTNNDLIIGICPGAKWETKRWPINKFVELGDKLISRLNAKVILIGDLNDLLIGEKIEYLMMNKPINLIGKTSLSELVALVKWCNIIITNDSSPLHVASSLKVPSISIFGPTTLDFGFGPYGEGHIVLEKDLSCRPCSSHGSKKCPDQTFKCMKLITSDEVLQAVKKILNRNG
ncbi:MAG: lipopolysaccharide heptosyltransferase II [bacterium]|nr:lipopolysaccharide heptosyltransferase II [bacterium]